MKILIIEDEAYSRQSLVKQIGQLDFDHAFELLESSNGRQGWQIFMREKPELVFSDIRMPFMNGLELLKRIMRACPETKVVMVSGFADFEYAQVALNDGAMGYLLKPVSESDLQQMIVKFHTMVTEQKAQYQKREDDELARYIQKCLLTGKCGSSLSIDGDFQRMFDQYRVAVISFYRDRLPENGLLSRNLYHILGGDSRTEYRLLNISSKQKALILRANIDLQEKLQKLAKLLQDSGFEFTVGISEAASSIDTIPNLYQQSLFAVKNRLFEPGNLMYYAESVKKQSGISSLPDSSLDLLRICMEKGDEPNAVLRVHKILEDIFSHQKSGVNHLENFTMKLNTLLHELLSRPDTPIVSGNQPGLSIDLLDYLCKDDLLQAIVDRLHQACSKAMDQKPVNTESLVEKVLDYINKNYNRDISLKELANDIFHLNHTYLSHLISEKTGRNYSSYLKIIRIGKAKEFLGNPDLSISDVASLSGYNDTSQFIQVFKQSVGMTPHKYKLVHSKPVIAPDRP